VTQVLKVIFTVKQTGQRWRACGVNAAAIMDAYSHAAATGSVGQRDTVCDVDPVTYRAGPERLLAEVHRIDETGKDVQPS